MSWILVWSGTKFMWKRKTPCMSLILVWSGIKFWWKRKTLLYVLNFGMVGNKTLVKKQHPPVCPEFWYGREQNSGEKTTPSCMSWILVWSGTKFMWKRKTPCMSLILVWSGTKFWWKRKTPLYVLNFGMVGKKFWWKRNTLLYVLNFGVVRNKTLVKKQHPLS